MNIFLDDEVEEVKPVAPSEDYGKQISPTRDIGDKRDGRPTKEEERSDLAKELIAQDSLDMGVRAAANIHGIGKTTAANYTKESDAKTRLIDQKFEIQNLAVAKLMQTLNLIDPSDVEKPRDRVAILNSLSQVVDKISNGDDAKKGTGAVHLHLYAPPQKKESDYEVIDA